jgi:hypothetical protein
MPDFRADGLLPADIQAASQRSQGRVLMNLESELDLRHAYEGIARLYQLCDRIAADTTGDAQTRADEIEGVKMMIRKIEKQLAAYFAAHPERAA